MHKERTFRDYLNALPKANLTSLLYGPEGKRIVSTTAVVSEVLRKFIETDFLAETLNKMEEPESGIFRFLLLQGNEGADRDTLRSHVRATSSEKLEEALRQLQNRLFIFGLKTTPFRYFVFREIREKLQPVLLAEGARILKRLDEHHDDRQCGDALFHDTTLLVLFLSRDSLKKTKNGAFNKKQLETLFRFFENRLEPGPGFPEKLPPLFSGMVDFLMLKELAEADSEELRITLRGRKWLDQENSERARSFYNHVIKGAKEEKARFLFQLLQTAEKPFETEGLIAFLHSREQGDKRPLPEIFDTLFAAGLVALSSHGKQGGIRLTERGSEILNNRQLSIETSDKITILPTFEFLVPRTASSQLLKMLFSIGHLEKSDTVMTFKISKVSMYEGFDRGVKPESLIKKLEEVSSHAIPQNLLFSLNEWVAAYGAVSFEMHFLLRTKTPELFNKIRSVLSGSAYIREEIPPVGFSINAADYEEVFSILTKLGHAPKPFTTVKEGNGEAPRKHERNILDTYLAEQGSQPDSGIEFILPDEPDEAPKSQKHKNGSKYGGKWKILPYNELVHVINYSILMDQGMELELKNGKGIVRLVPKELTLYLSEPKLIGIDPVGGEKVEVNLNDIEKVRVEER